MARILKSLFLLLIVPFLLSRANAQSSTPDEAKIDSILDALEQGAAVEELLMA